MLPTTEYFSKLGKVHVEAHIIYCFVIWVPKQKFVVALKLSSIWIIITLLQTSISVHSQQRSADAYECQSLYEMINSLIIEVRLSNGKVLYTENEINSNIIHIKKNSASGWQGSSNTEEHIIKVFHWNSFLEQHLFSNAVWLGRYQTFAWVLPSVYCS